jgi:hypothetical protein
MSAAEHTRTNRKVQTLGIATPSNLECKNQWSCGEPFAKFTFDKDFGDQISKYTPKAWQGELTRDL